MFLRQFTNNRMITIDYDTNGTSKTLKGKVCGVNLKEQVLFLKDEKQKSFSIKLSGIRHIH
ncbi:hypothetical protein [Neobacillus sp. SAB-20_R2A]|uniref:hypothetical protein n=1 Tax=Neobacillus sp. SAB-20_R2A TaxID=3120519 RepID=UPI003C6DE534